MNLLEIKKLIELEEKTVLKGLRMFDSRLTEKQYDSLKVNLKSIYKKI